MINWTRLIKGLIFLVLGLIGLVFRSTIKDENKNSLTSAGIIWGTYGLLITAVLFIISAFLESE